MVHYITHNMSAELLLKTTTCILRMDIKTKTRKQGTYLQWNVCTIFTKQRYLPERIINVDRKVN